MSTESHVCLIRTFLCQKTHAQAYWVHPSRVVNDSTTTDSDSDSDSTSWDSDSDSDSGVYQILWFRFWFRFQWSMIPIPTPIPGFPKNFDSDSDSRVTGFWFRFQGFPNSMIPIPILIPVIHDSNSDSRDSHIFWFRFHVSDFDSNFDSTVVLTIPTSTQFIKVKSLWIKGSRVIFPIVKFLKLTHYIRVVTLHNQKHFTIGCLCECYVIFITNHKIRHCTMDLFVITSKTYPEHNRAQ